MARVLVVDRDREVFEVISHVLGPDNRTDWLKHIVDPVPVVDHYQPAVVFVELTDDAAEMTGTISGLLATGGAPSVVCVVGEVAGHALSAAFRAGAEDLLKMPLAAGDVRRVFASACNRRSAGRLPAMQSADNLGLIGRSDAIGDVRRQVRLLARFANPVLILGESGSGKDLVARAIHRNSKFRNGPFVAYNCGAIPDALFEAEMFGSEKGAYTDAVSRKGAFELANYGTIFLDEVAELSLHAQVKLLRALDERAIRRVGGSSTIQLRSRVMAATNQDLRAMMEESRFRADLYYRISVTGVWVPPLRNRPEDIPLLVQHFLGELYEDDPDAPRASFSSRALEHLRHFPWPGNVRELRNVVHRSAIYASGRTVEPRDIRFEVGRHDRAAGSPDTHVDERAPAAARYRVANGHAAEPEPAYRR